MYPYLNTIMSKAKVLHYIEEVLKNSPAGWLTTTTHRLDIYNEELAKTQFLNQFEELFDKNDATVSALDKLPTAYDYIRLGHPLSCVLEWTMAQLNHLTAESVISFSSQSVPVLAVLRKNLFDNKKTKIYYTSALPKSFDTEIIKTIYGYDFELEQLKLGTAIPAFEGSSILISEDKDFNHIMDLSGIDFLVSLHGDLGSILIVNGKDNESYIGDIQHVRRRETIAMTPADCLSALENLISETSIDRNNNLETDKKSVLNSIMEITGSPTKALVASSGLSIQYAIIMGLIHDASENHKGKPSKLSFHPIVTEEPTTKRDVLLLV